MPFDGATWTTPDIAAAPAMRRVQRRDDDQRLAAMLVEGGVPAAAVYGVPDDEDVEDCVLSDDGEWAEGWGRPLRRWSGFPSQAHASQARRALLYAAFSAQRGIDRVRQVRVSAPVCSVPLTALRHVHAETSRRLMERLRYGIARYAPGLRIDMIAAEIVRDGPGFAYLHFHLVTRGGTLAELSALRGYWTSTRAGLPTGWDWWDAETDTGDEDDRTERHPAALVQYLSKGLAAALDDDWTPEEIGEFFRQTRGVAMVRAAGEFRRWLGDLDRAGMTVRRGDYGCAVIVPKRPQRLGIRRHRERLFTTVGFSVLRRLEEYDFGDGRKRRAWLVRGHAGLTMTDLAAVYMLADASTDYAPIPESLPATAIGHPQSPDETRPPAPPTGMD